MQATASCSDAPCHMGATRASRGGHAGVTRGSHGGHMGVDAGDRELQRRALARPRAKGGGGGQTVRKQTRERAHVGRQGA
eukprot:98748-Prymnesium_polylepis.1